MVSSINCQQPGCSGAIEDGFCLSCGMESPVAAATGTIARGTSTTSAGSLSAKSSLLTSGTTGTGRGSSWIGTRGTRATRGTRGTRGTGASSSRQTLGMGLVQIPELPPLDPATVIMANPSVPENKRFCPQCEQKLNREKGFCPKCGKAYSFLPTLSPGDVVAGQYEVLGAMAFGGLGWIYLAKDTALNRWVVLKGLLNVSDASSAAVAVAERQFLAAVKHPNIVGVYNFVERGTEGYIVMEFVRGKTLKDIRKERGPLPVPEAIAYIHRVLGAFAYLHRQDPPLIYCDFKPDNVMLEGDDLKLIDLGAVRGEDDPGGEVYGTKGYSAPEGGDEPSIYSDLYTVARSLAVLTMDFKNFQSAHQFTLPGPSEQPLFAQFDSYYRFLLKATRKNPLDRFESAEEMAEQLAGVLREIVAMSSGNLRPAESSHFGGDPLYVIESKPTGIDLVKSLPGLKMDTSDPAASYLLTNSGTGDEGNLVREAVNRYPQSLEARLRLALYQSQNGLWRDAVISITSARNLDPESWKVSWYFGLNVLGGGNWKEAIASFDKIYSDMPGELAPKLALALAYESGGEFQQAAKYFEIVSLTDPSFISATFGLARCQRDANELDQAVQAYSRVPASSQFYAKAQIAKAKTWLRSNVGNQVVEAASAIEALALDGHERHRLFSQVLYRALEVLKLTPHGSLSPDVRIFGNPMNESYIRRGLEENLRGLAKLSKDRLEREYLVDMANSVRPVTWI